MDIINSIIHLHDHSWLVFNTNEDIARSAIWITTQLATALAYFAIPIEYTHWKAALPFRFVSIIAIFFIGFTVFCGAHHVTDVIMMPTAPWWAILYVNIPMMIFSVITAVYLRINRAKIVTYFHLLSETLDYYGVVKKE